MAQSKTLSLPSVLLLGANGIIGSGIFLLPQKLYQEAGWNSLLAIALAGATTTIIALNYAHLASCHDRDGGAWSYADAAFGDFAGFTTGWFAWFLGIITIAAEVAAFLTTLGGLWPAIHQRPLYIGVALGLIGLLGVINWFGPGLIKPADNLASGFKLTVILIFVIGGGWAVSHTGWILTPLTDTHDQLLTGAVAAFYMFTGFSFLPTAAHDMRNPTKVLPIALVTIMLVVSDVYMLVQAVTVALLGPALAHSSLPVAAAFATIFGPWGRGIILVGMLGSILGVALAVAFAAPLGAASMAQSPRLLPAVFGRNNRHGAPGLAIIITTGIAGLLVVSGGYLFLVQLIIWCSFLQYIITALAALRLTPLTRPWWEKWPVPIMTIAIVLVLLPQFDWSTYLLGGLVFLVGCGIYAIDRHSAT